MYRLFLGMLIVFGNMVIVDAALFRESIYGVAAYDEDPSSATLSLGIFDSTYSGKEFLYWNTRLSVERIPDFGITGVSSGTETARIPIVHSGLHTVKTIFAVSHTRIQVAGGYQPLRIRDTYRGGPRIDMNGELYRGVFITDFRNSDRFSFLINGVTPRKNESSFFYGVQSDLERICGTTVTVSEDFENRNDYIYYDRYRRGDGNLTLTAGAGYLKKYRWGKRPMKYCLLLEADMLRQYQGFGFDNAIAPYLMELNSAVPQYNYIITARSLARTFARGRVHFMVSDRYATAVPWMDDKGGNFTGDVETVDISIGVDVHRYNDRILKQSNVFPEGWSEVQKVRTKMIRPAYDNRYSFRLFWRNPLLHKEVRHYLINRFDAATHAEGFFTRQRRLVRHSVTFRYQVGTGVLIRKKIYAGLSWQALILQTVVSYYKDGRYKRLFHDGDILSGGRSPAWRFELTLVK
jgi:hypothetical protein